MPMDAPMFNWDSIPVRMITLTQPALGADLAVAETTVPAGKKWLFVSAYLNVGTSGAADWTPVVAIDNGTAFKRMWKDSCTIMAATVSTIQIQESAIRTATGAYAVLPIGTNMEMPAGYSFRQTGTTADDRWGESYFFYKEAPA